MASNSFLVRYRPAKIGFLIRDGSIDDLVDAAKLNTLHWGGVHNPILPISEDYSKGVELVERVPVDALYPVKETDAINNVLKEFPYLRSPRHYDRRIFVKGWSSEKYIPAYLDILHAIQRNYEKYFRGTPKEEKSTCVLVRWRHGDKLKHLFPLLFGEYAQDELLLEDDFELAFLKGLRSHEVEITRDGALPEELAEKTAPLLFTRTDTLVSSRTTRTTRFNDNGIFIGDPNSFADLLFFWTIRANGTLLSFLPTEDNDRFLAFTQATLDVFEKRVSISAPASPFLAFYHRDLPDEQVRDIAKTFKCETRWTNHNISDICLADSLQKLPTDYLSWDFTLGSVDNQGPVPKVTITLPEKKFLPDADRETESQSLLVSVDEMLNYEYPSFTLKPPYIPRLNEFYSRAISVDPFQVRSEEDGIGLFVDVRETHVDVHPVAYMPVVQNVLELAGIDAEQSQAGRLAHRIIEHLGSLEECAIFMNRGVRKLFRRLGTQDVTTRSQAQNEIYQVEMTTRQHRRSAEAREPYKIKPAAIFDRLLRHQFFRAGLKLKCERCRLSNWLSLKTIDDYWICEYCGESNLTSVQLQHRGDWMFRRSGLFGKENNQEGSIPVLLTLRFFKQRFEPSEFIFTPSLNLRTESKHVETDLFVMRHDERRNIEIAIGECKDEGGSIDKEDVAKLEAVRGRLTEQGMTCYLVFSKTADEFTFDELVLFRECQSRKVPLILLSNRELESTGLIESEIEENLPVNCPRTCNELHRNSLARYLG